MVPFVSGTEPSVIMVVLESFGDGRMLSSKTVSEAHCHATDSLVSARHAEFCCWGNWTGIAKCPRGIGSIVWGGDEPSSVDSVLKSISLEEHALDLPKNSSWSETYLEGDRCLAAMSASPTVSRVATCTARIAIMRCFTDNFAHKVDGIVGNGLSARLVSIVDARSTSFSA